MEALGKEQLLKWVDAFRNLNDEYVHFDGLHPFFTHPEGDCISLEYPPKLERLTFFARAIATIGYEPWHFNGALLWFTEWGVWNALDEAVGYRVVEAMHAAAGQPKAFETFPGHHFRADELTEAVGMLIQPMIIGWDAYFLPRWSYGTDEFFIYVSHDSYVCVVTRSKAFYQKAFDTLNELELNPQRVPLHSNRFRRAP